MREVLEAEGNDLVKTRPQRWIHRAGIRRRDTRGGPSFGDDSMRGAAERSGPPAADERYRPDLPPADRRHRPDPLRQTGDIDRTPLPPTGDIDHDTKEAPTGGSCRPLRVPIEVFGPLSYWFFLWIGGQIFGGERA